MILAPEDDNYAADVGYMLADDILVPWTRRMLHTGGPCVAPIEAHCE